MIQYDIDSLRVLMSAFTSGCHLSPEDLFSFQNFAKFFKIFRHIESLDAYMKH
jgi:hypothetical protein